MKDKITFGRFETTSLIMVLMTAQLLLNLPRTIMEVAGTAAWLLIVYISVITFVIF